MYLTPTDKHWVFDLEANGLDPTQVWVLCATNAVTGEERLCETYDEIRAFFEDTKGCYYVGHNIIAYDVPVLNRLVNTRIPINACVDTFILSSVYSPSVSGGHSLGAWGKKLKLDKIEHEEWHEYSEAMRERCKRDVEINWQLFNRLTKRMREIGFTERGIEIETRAWFIIQKQRKNGFYFNYQQAHELYTLLRGKERELSERIDRRFPPEIQLLASYKKARKADGSHSEQFKRHLEQFERCEVQPDGSYDIYGYVSFKLSSNPQRIEKLQSLGWIPKERTKPSRTYPEGQPKATEHGDLVASLREFVEESGIEEVNLLATWIAVNKRANDIRTWMNAYNEDTKCIHGNLWLANTLRYRHDAPNTANIPSVRTKKDENGKEIVLKGESGLWTYEARDLWQTRDRKTRRLVGVDAKGIQLRVLAHYLNDPAFTEAILSEDPHEANAKRMGLNGRRIAKTITYAVCMGAGVARVASEAKITEPEAVIARNAFFKQVPGLKPLIKRLQQEVRKTGRITLCDGTKILVSSPHMVIPYLLQGDESRIMKQAAIYVDEGVRRERFDVLKVGDIHDEWQNDALLGHIGGFKQICKEGFAKAGTSFNYNLPIECEVKEGFTWAETH